MDPRRVEGFSFEIIAGPIMHVTWEGEATQQSIQAMRDYAAAAHREYGPGVVARAIIDASAATGVDRGAREQLTALGKDRPWEHLAFVGVRFELKVLLELVAKALRLMKIETAQFEFFDARTEALTWLASHAPPTRES